ncbi:MAG: RNA polymerase sigma factor [Chitinophagaceae bacterium]|nr:RNA polymerase sigma factor [Chitinophagaceae bacterium]
MLYDKFASKMYGVCMRYAGNTNDANDIMQDGFIRVFSNLQKFRGDGSFEGWVRRIFVNTCIEHYRKKVQSYNINEAHENTVEDTNLDAMDVLAAKDIVKLVNSLSPGYKTVFNLHVVEGYNHKEIAEMLGISEGTSKSQLARAKALLKKTIENHYNSIKD